MACASIALLVNWQGRETRIGPGVLISFLSWHAWRMEYLWLDGDISVQRWGFYKALTHKQKMLTDPSQLYGNLSIEGRNEEMWND